MLDKLFKFQNRLKKSHTVEYKRYLYKEIDFKDKMIAIFGARGVGKTTLLFQYLQELTEQDKNVLYISMDYPFLVGVDLIDIVEEFVQSGGEYLLLDEIHRYNDFRAYLKTGYYPFYFDKQSSYYENLLNTINLTIDLDLTSLGLIEQKYTYKLKKLLEVVCESKPFEVNYTKIAAAAEISRAKVYDYVEFLNDGEMLLLVDEYVKGIKKINKPAKIYLNNTNLLFAYCEKRELGTVRETFFANQVSVKNRLNIAKQGDFLVEGKYVFEIGGKEKGFKQIKDLAHSYVVSDDMELGHANKIPLWLFGFLY